MANRPYRSFYVQERLWRRLRPRTLLLSAQNETSKRVGKIFTATRVIAFFPGGKGEQWFGELGGRSCEDPHYTRAFWRRHHMKYLSSASAWRTLGYPKEARADIAAARKIRLEGRLGPNV